MQSFDIEDLAPFFKQKFQISIPENLKPIVSPNDNLGKSNPTIAALHLKGDSSHINIPRVKNLNQIHSSPIIIWLANEIGKKITLED